MKAKNLSDLFEKLNDLKSIFHYGQKLIPIIQSLIDFMQETVPLLENINNSIAESTSKIPKAQNQISDVTNATELATTEILDLVDVISMDTAKADTILRHFLEEEIKRETSLEKLKEIVKDNPEALALVNEISISEKSKMLEPLKEIFQKINNDAYNITISLQVQDITSQQLSAVNHLIESVQEKLASLLFDFNEANIKEGEHEFPENGTFNPDARYEHSGEKQSVVDDLLDMQKSNNLGKASQEEIDKLFS